MQRPIAQGIRTQKPSTQGRDENVAAAVTMQRLNRLRNHQQPAATFPASQWHSCMDERCCFIGTDTRLLYKVHPWDGYHPPPIKTTLPLRHPSPVTRHLSPFTCHHSCWTPSGLLTSCHWTCCMTPRSTKVRSRAGAPSNIVCHAPVTPLPIWMWLFADQLIQPAFATACNAFPCVILRI